PDPRGITFQVTDSATVQLDTNSVQLTFDGTNVVPAITKSGTVTSVQYHGPTLLTVGSSHTSTLAFGTGPSAVSIPYSFTVAPYGVIPGTIAVASNSVDQTKPGFK